MRIVFRKTVTPNLDSEQASELCSDIISELQIDTGLKLRAANKQDTVEGHVTVIYDPSGVLTVWLFPYDNDGKHESEKGGQIVIQDNPRAKRSLMLPNRTTIINMIRAKGGQILR